MALTKRNQALIKAVRGGDLSVLQIFLDDGYSPAVKGAAPTTPLHEAVREGRIDMVRALVKAGAPVNKQDSRGKTAADLAQILDDRDIVRYLQRRGACLKHQRGSSAQKSRRMKSAKFLAGGGMPEAAPQKKESPFKADKLKDIFNPESWIGKTDEMQKLWQEVPSRLQEKFDFAAALAEAQRISMQRNFSGAKMQLKK